MFIRIITSIALGLLATNAFGAPAQSWYSGKPIEVTLVATQGTSGHTCEINCTEILAIKEIGSFFAVRGPGGGYVYIGSLTEEALKTVVTPLTQLNLPVTAVVDGVSNMQPLCVRNCAFTVSVEGRGTLLVSVRPNGRIGHTSILDGDQGSDVDSNNSISTMGTSTCTSYPYKNCRHTSGGSTGDCATCVYYVTFYYNSSGMIYKIEIHENGKTTTKYYSVE